MKKESIDKYILVEKELQFNLITTTLPTKKCLMKRSLYSKTSLCENTVFTGLTINENLHY
jgi:hypothetical protein